MSKAADFLLGDSLGAFVRRDDAQRFVEERELDAGSPNQRTEIRWARRYMSSSVATNSRAVVASGIARITTEDEKLYEATCGWQRQRSSCDECKRALCSAWTPSRSVKRA